MRQNISDDEAFYQGCADLRASPGNLSDLVEQPTLRGLGDGARSGRTLRRGGQGDPAPT